MLKRGLVYSLALFQPSIDLFYSVLFSFLVPGSLIFRVKRKRRVLGLLTGLLRFDQRKPEAVEHRAVD